MQLTNLTDPVELTHQMIDIPSVSGDEGPLADAVEAALRGAGFGSAPSLEILRDGDAVCARTRLGLGQRVVLAGHLDTVPIADNVPGRFEERDGATVLWGRGSVDMLGGCAAALALACEVGAVLRSVGEAALSTDVTWIFYDHEEVASHLNGLGRVQRNHPAVARRRPGAPGGAHRRPRGRRLQRNPARHRALPGACRPLGACVDGHQCDSRDGPRHRAHRRLRKPRRGGRWPRIPRIPVGRTRRGRHRQQRDPRGRLDDRQLPLRPLEARRRGPGVGARPLRGHGRHD